MVEVFVGGINNVALKRRIFFFSCTLVYKERRGGWRGGGGGGRGIVVGVVSFLFASPSFYSSARRMI